MDNPRRAEGRSRSLVVGLYLNAALLAGLLLVLLSRDGAPMLPTALAQQAPQPIAGGAGLFLMPAQFAPSKWGCYVMDVDAQTLVAYEYDPRDRSLRLAAARQFSFDRQLKDYNTFPSPSEVEAMVEQERNRGRIEGTPQE